MAKEKVLEEKEKMNPFLWFLFAIVIPIIIAITLTVIVFAVAGVNVVDWAKNTGNNIPVLSSIITTDEEARETQKEEDIQGRLDAKDAEIEQLTADNTNLESTIEQLEQEIVKLERDLNASSNVEDTTDETQETVKQISSSFSEMKSEQAALILQELEDDVAIAILSEMSNEDRGLIMESMTPDRAATLTEQFLQN
ncbi:MotE family protein [Ornithinibacillus xuwenensis]|uniref:Magnesium transporter MgtE intracellular domain-containing protein n=1 Tax=Ornithinibacillus xuwenensis TaxID=3144668 RepID=A0ABU9XDV7_9BACI